jgi:hypothetical protein
MRSLRIASDSNGHMTKEVQISDIGTLRVYLQRSFR